MRKDHTFKFQADVIAAAAEDEAAYHKERMKFWKNELARSIKIVKKTASIKWHEYQVTGGSRREGFINYGDQAAYSRANEAKSKIESHQQMLSKFETDARVYGTQGTHEYELSTEDVRYFRLGGEPRED
jgi:hypothetical protein